MESVERLEELLSKAVRGNGGKVIYLYHETEGEPEPGPSVTDLGLPEELVRSLEARGIARLYRFQWDAISRIRQGKDTIIVAGTGTGKTEAFMIPLIERALKGRGERFLLVYPTKALARDQARRLSSLLSGVGLRYAVLDGDTPPAERRSIYEDPPSFIITNPDMIHVGLAESKDFRELVSGISAAVFDEMHVYQGVLGSHVKWVIYRLSQAAGRLQLVGAGATIGNPGDLGAKLFSRQDVEVVEGPRRRRGEAVHAFVDYGRLSRWSFAAYLIASLASEGLKVLGFTDSQQMAELVARIIRRNYNVNAEVHRAGLPAEHRRKVEREFAEGTLNAVVATSTLELGIDIGDLDAVVMASLPKSYSSYVQRAGRAGRRGRPGLVATLMGDDPIEAYYASRPQEFFSREPDPGYIEPGNAEVTKLHLVALAMQRGALRRSSLPRELQVPITWAVDKGLLSLKGDIIMPQWRPAREFLASQGLRSTGPMVKIVLNNKVVGEREMPMALYDLHPGALYYHAGQPLLSSRLDLSSMRAYTVKLSENVNFYTKPLYSIDILEVRAESSTNYGPVAAAYGDVHVQVSVTGYVIKDEFSGATLNEVEYESPITWDYWTKGVALRYPLLEFDTLESSLSAYHALEHVLIAASRPVVGASDTDLSGVSYPTGHIVIYDSHVGGNGASRLVYERLLKIQEIAKSIVSSCTCEDGCPRCVYSPYCGNNNRYLSRHGALRVLNSLTLAEKERLEVDEMLRWRKLKAA
ncbi:DEAD/DEAH box helicase [Acidilobus sp.]|uniref:DEAD/DEAH box helicase n=1 Tax=Acidilobus sp. TaxID=1872109 RepID=UPI003D029E0A